VTTDPKNPNGLLVQEIAERMSGNICRCSAYPNIVDAISQVLESEVSNKRASSSEETTTGSLQDSAVTGIWSPPPSQSQLGNQSVNHNKNASSTAGGRS
jgi:xanthine dehydrogenase YagT iron-sulfur-binding subunit